MSDIAGQKRAEEAPAQTTARFHGIISSAMDAIISVDSHQRIVLFNPAAEKMFGVPAGEALGESINRFIPERFRGAHTHHVENFGLTGVSMRRMGALGTIVGLRASGEEFPIEASISQVEIGGERLFTVILRDITERKRAEEALRQSEQRLQAANRELTDFATVVSHDLKTPLRGVATLAKWLQSDYADKLDAEGRESLAEMVDRIRRMDRMIEGILHYSRLGRTEENPEPVPLGELVAEVVQDLAPAADVRVRVAPHLPLVYGEPVRLRQVFQNLIGNAIKHGNKAEIDVCVDCTDSGPFWQFSVVDNGRGIEERHFERIFKIFQTLAPKDTTDSTGVGLALVKRIVECAGGRVWVESRRGEGSTFHFTWPKGPQTAFSSDSTEAAGTNPSALQPTGCEQTGTVSERGDQSPGNPHSGEVLVPVCSCPLRASGSESLTAGRP
jgi:two-component system, LuxR family, sensor kinase FixL